MDAAHVQPSEGSVERPIPFKGRLVTATLRQVDPKTETRRLIQFPKDVKDAEPCSLERWRDGKYDQRMADPDGRLALFHSPSRAAHPPDGRGRPPTGNFGLRPKHGVVGDQLWVREAWEARDYGVIYVADGRARNFARVRHAFLDGVVARHGIGVRPAMFMPRWMSRIDLLVLDARAERLQAMTHESAKAEGLETRRRHVQGMGEVQEWRGAATGWWSDPRDAFASLWDSYNKPGALWADNPWVWAYKYRLLRLHEEDETE